MSQTSAGMRGQIDPRGPQFAAGLTSVVLAVVLLTAPSPLAVGLLGLQAVLFGVGATLGVTRTPHAWLFRRLVRPRLAAPRHLEDAAPPQFAQAVGLGFAVVGLIGFLVGADLVGLVATGRALAAALLNAVFGFCLGCEVYLLAVRTRSRARSAAGLTTHVHRTSTTT
jgi:hypothetical protein